jgi:hypothetical protein
MRAQIQTEFEKYLLPFRSTFFKYILYQYSETNVMRLLFILLRIKGLYMFRALLVSLLLGTH